MKRKLSLFLAVIMLVGILPFQVFAELNSAETERVAEKTEVNEGLQVGDEIKLEPVGEGEITLNRIGQWTGESSKKIDDKKTYSSVNDPIGDPIPNGGLLRSFAKVFLGWSDLQPQINGKVADGSRLFSSQDTLKTYQDYVDKKKIEKEKKGEEYLGNKDTIYGIYYEINGFNMPLAGDAFEAVGQVLGNVGELKSLVNKNQIFIDKNKESKNILMETKILEDNRSIKKENSDLIDIIGRYEDKDIEVGLESEFSMDDSMAMLAYKNKVGTNQLKPILSSDYDDRFKKGDFPTKDGTDARYTYVDLNIDFGDDKGLVVPDNLFLEFKSYSWRPLYAFGIKDDNSKERLEILTPDGVSKGNKFDAFKGLVSGDKPETKFGVKTNKFRRITIRVILREWDYEIEKPHQNPFSGERIPENTIKKGPEGTIASEILSNMTLKILGSSDGKEFVKITKEKAKELADTNAKEKLEIKGSIEGLVYLNAAGFEIPVPINKLESKKFSLSFIHEKETPPTPKPQPKPEPKPEPEPEKEIEFKTHEYVPTTPVYAQVPKTEVGKEVHKAYIFGYEDKSVRANGNLTRAEAAAMVTRLAGLDLSDGPKADYKDLKDKAWYLTYINAALKAGMLDADGENLRPNDKITRAEFAKMLAAIDKENDYQSKFEDIKGHKYEKEINKIDGNKRIEGYEDGTFRPDAFLTRAEAASFLNRMFNRIADEEAISNLEGYLVDFTDLKKSDWFYFEITEAANSHYLNRRGGADKYQREYEKWTSLISLDEVKK